MKWFFRITGLVILLFAGLALMGYFTSPLMTVTSSTEIDAAPEDVFPFMNDLRAFNSWSPWHAANPDADYVFGGADSGIGANVIWREPGINAEQSATFSSQEIIASQPPEFVQTQLVLGGEPASATYALSETEDGQTLVLIQYESELGDFPYVQRLAKSSRRSAMETDFESALQRLKTIAENQN